MPKSVYKDFRFPLMRLLSDEYDRVSQVHYGNAPKGGAIPVGGGDWMDSFFRMEAIRGCLNGLRLGKPLTEAVADGKAVSEISVKLWNGKREWQVHRWKETAHSYLERLVIRLQRKFVLV